LHGWFKKNCVVGCVSVRQHLKGNSGGVEKTIGENMAVNIKLFYKKEVVIEAVQRKRLACCLLIIS
jgi:hypothetical protein